MDKGALLAPSRFRFTVESDVQAYGDQWYRYDELSIITRPGRELIELEQEMGSSVADVFRGFRAGTTMGEMYASWLALRCMGNPVKLDDYNPIVHLMEWAKGEPDPEGKEPASGEAPTTSTTRPVSLPTLPVTE